MASDRNFSAFRKMMIAETIGMRLIAVLEDQNSFLA
jgi:hypothetical protein